MTDSKPVKAKRPDVPLTGGLMPHTEDAALAEYAAAQASAEHHDNLAWSATGILWVASTVLLGFVLQVMSEGKTTERTLLLLVAIFGLLLTVVVWWITKVMRDVKTQKYQRCKAIEEAYGMHQHTDLQYPRRVQFILYTVVLGFLAFIWLVVLWHLACVSVAVA
ncbi:MAG: hypothetical protein HY369_01615 [Candidatus Aenigmarchaeota archaeon]|nr:hypothetical protein [Candidatus Aenigmarchaeota archaeon]